jgi:hypothetical protein
MPRLVNNLLLTPALIYEESLLPCLCRFCEAVRYKIQKNVNTCISLADLAKIINTRDRTLCIGNRDIIVISIHGSIKIFIEEIYPIVGPNEMAKLKIYPGYYHCNYPLCGIAVNTQSSDPVCKMCRKFNIHAWTLKYWLHVYIMREYLPEDVVRMIGCII